VTRDEVNNNNNKASVGWPDEGQKIPKYVAIKIKKTNN
jgi:hypothetical protein